MAGKGGECSAVQSEFHSISSQDGKEEKEEEPTFIEQPPDRFICLICHCVMREPHIVTCCCNKMCRDCIQRVHLSGQPCPTCREPNFSIFLEKRLNSEILDLKVRCTHHNNGCEWVGELRDLKKHTNPVNGSCGFVKVKCPFGCPVPYLRKDTIDHESVCTNLPPEKQVKRTMRITDQFKEELQAMLSQFQELYKLESTRVKELTTQLEVLKESHKKEQQEMKHQFEAEKKQLLEESKQQITMLTQEMKMKNEEHQQQMMQLQQEFKKKEKERSEAVNKHLAELKEKEKKMEEQHQKQLTDIKDKLSTELKELYHDEHEQRMEESKEESKNIHQKLKQHYDEEYQQQLKEAKRTLELEKRKQVEEVRIVLAAEKEKLITKYAEECKKATAGGSNEAAATGGSSAGDGKTFTGLSKDVLLLMSKVRKDCSKNMQFFPEEGKVIVLASSEEEREQCIMQFQNAYQEIIKNRQLKSGGLEVPPAFQMENMFDIIEEFDAKYSQCHFSCDEKARVIKIVSMSSHQFHDAKKLLGDRLAGEKGGATGSVSAGDGKTFFGLSKDVLLLMPKVREDCSKNMQFFPEEGKVVVLASSEEEREQCITQFQNTYQEIIKNRQLKSGSLEIPPAFQMEDMFGLLDEFDGKYNQCHFSCDEKARVVRIVSMSSRQFDVAKKLLGDRLAGEKWEEKTGKNKGGGGKPGKGAMRFKISTKPGSSEVLVLEKHRKLTVKRGNLVEEDVEIIVNDANGELKHAGGVALALNKATNGELQKVSNNYTKNYGDVPVGGTALTRSGGGKLKCKWVMHAVGPTAHEMKSEVTCSDLIFKAISNSLIEAQKRNVKSISFPALSTGIFAVDKSLAADAIFQAITKFHYTSSKLLTDIRIIILDEETYSVFAQHLLAIKAAGTEALSSKEETSFQTASDHTVSTTSHHQGYSTPTYQGHHGQPTQVSYSSPVGGGHSSFGSHALGTERHPTAGRGISSTATPPGFYHSPITTQPTGPGHPAIPPHTTVPPTTATGRGDIMLKSSLFNYGGLGREGEGIGGFAAETGGIQAGGFDKGGEGGFGGVGQRGDIWPQQVPKLLTPAELAQTPPVGITRSTSHDGHYSTPPDPTPDSLTRSKGEGATPSNNKTDNDKGCSICLNEVAKDPMIMKCCTKIFCRICISKALEHSSLCPNCRVAVKQVEGNQPPGTMSHYVSRSSLPGYEGYGTIVIEYIIPGGIQTNEHPNPGQRYHGTTRSAYLPNTPKGQEVLQLLKKAFNARLIFTVGTSHTTSASNSVVWNDIHHKTAIHGDPYGYPDPNYLSRVKEELKAKGIQ